jgi:hypothetical protein
MQRLAHPAAALAAFVTLAGAVHAAEPATGSSVAAPAISEMPAPVKAGVAGADVRPAPTVPATPAARPIDPPLFQDDEEQPVGTLGSPGFEMDWFTVDGGGTTFHTGGNFELAGTAGQADAGVHTGGNFTLSGGFWGRVRMDECAGDADGNNIVNFADITAVLANWLDFGATGDANNDWFVDFQDITSVLANFGASCS